MVINHGMVWHCRECGERFEGSGNLMLDVQWHLHKVHNWPAPEPSKRVEAAKKVEYRGERE